MSKTDATDSAPTPAPGDKSSDEQLFYQRNLYMVMTLNMTWQLAVAVLVPVLGGYYLDQHFGTSPWLLVAGAIIALLGFIGVLMRVVVISNQRVNQPSESDKMNPKKKETETKETE